MLIVATIHTILLNSLSRLLRRVTVAQALIKREIGAVPVVFLDPFATVSTEICQVFLMITKLVKNRSFSLLWVFHFWITKIKKDFFDVDPKDDLWNCLFLMVI